MSSPEGKSVNDGIQESRAPCHMWVWRKRPGGGRQGSGALMVKVDVQSAYRHIPIHPDDQLLMGMLWEGDLYIDMALPFGLRSAPKIFMAIADAAEWVVKQEGGNCIIHYLDHSFLVDSPKH